MMSDAIRAVILGIVEGITEFLPVSSTGHMLLVKRFFGLGEGAFWDSFVVLIQLGAILAIVVLYLAKLWRVATGMSTHRGDRRVLLRLLHEPRRDDDRSPRHYRDRIRGFLHHRDDRGEDVPGLRHAPQLYVFCVVARHRRHARPDRAGAGAVRNSAASS